MTSTFFFTLLSYRCACNIFNEMINWHLLCSLFYSVPKGYAVRIPNKIVMNEVYQRPYFSCSDSLIIWITNYIKTLIRITKDNMCEKHVNDELNKFTVSVSVNKSMSVCGTNIHNMLCVVFTSSWLIPAGANGDATLSNLSQYPYLAYPTYKLIPKILFSHHHHLIMMMMTK